MVLVQVLAAVPATGETLAVPPRAVVRVEDDQAPEDSEERAVTAVVELDTTNEALLDSIAPHVRAPESLFTDAEAKQLADFRDEFERTKTRKYTTPSGKGQAQVELQDAMASLVEKERRAKLATVVRVALAPKLAAPVDASPSPSTPPPTTTPPTTGA